MEFDKLNEVSKEKLEESMFDVANARKKYFSAVTQLLEENINLKLEIVMSFGQRKGHQLLNLCNCWRYLPHMLKAKPPEKFTSAPSMVSSNRKTFKCCNHNPEIHTTESTTLLQRVHLQNAYVSSFVRNSRHTLKEINADLDVQLVDTSSENSFREALESVNNVLEILGFHRK